MPLESGTPHYLQRAQKGRRLWLGDEVMCRAGEHHLDSVAPAYGVKYSWRGLSSSAMDSLRLVLWAQSLGKNEEFMAALGWRHFSDDAELADHKVLIEAAGEAGLSREEAAQVLASNRFAHELQSGAQTWGYKTTQRTPFGGGFEAGGIPVLLFRTENPRLEEKLQGSVPQHEVEAVLRKLEALVK